MNNWDYKQLIISHLLDQGFKSYAQRFMDIKFVVAEMYDGSLCPTAFMVPKKNVICINPGFFDVQDPDNQAEIDKRLDLISVVIRHELLHFLLSHEKRFIAYLKKKYPKSWGRYYANPQMHDIANFAMDLDLCNEAYDPEDKELIKNFALNGKYISGLVTEEVVNNDSVTIGFNDGTAETFSGSQFNNWEKMSMEKMWQMLNDAHQQYTKQDPAIISNDPSGSSQDLQPDKNKSDEYKDMFNKVVAKFGDGKATINELMEVYGRLMAEDDALNIDHWKFKEQWTSK